MVSLDKSPPSSLERRYAESTGDPSFAEVMDGCSVTSEDDLADLIELDGRKRISLERPVELSRYLDAIPDLASRSVALDAAIDVTLRSMSMGRRPDSDAVRTLALNYPQFERAIRDAAVLGRSMLPTAEVHQALMADLPKSLPSDFGPPMTDGRARYELLELVGAGASGAVYRANDRQLSDTDRPALVAIKLMRFRDQSPWARQRFVEEATKARRIVHPNVARVLDRGIAAGDIDFIVYEYVDGGDLHAWFEARGGPVPERLAAAIVAKIARAVQAAHIAGLVHCDLKPGNILLSEGDEPKVTDFGIAVRSATGAEPAPTPDQPPGSLAFAAPEQLRRDEGALATPADVYALGGLLFFLLTGDFPNGRSPEEVRGAQDRVSGRTAAPDPHTARPSIDADLRAICRRALAPAPDGRHGSAADLASDLEAWLASQPIYWTKPSLARILRLWSRRRPWSMAAAVAMLVVIGISGAIAARSWSTAVVRGAEATLADARLAKTKSELTYILKSIRLLQAQHVERDLLPTVMAMEWLQGTTVLGTPENRTAIWEERTRVVTDMLRRARQTGRADDVDILTWQSALAFWLVTDGRYDEAAPVLSDNIARWSAIARPGDTWIVKMKAVAAAAEVQRLRALGAVDSSPGSPLRAAEAALLEADRLFTGQAVGTPVHALVLRSLVDIYGPDLLDAPRDRRRYEKKLDAATE